eukprot:gene3889-7102_t
MDFFVDTLNLEDELPQEHIEFLSGFMNEASTEEITEVLNEKKFLKNFISIFSKTKSNETVEAIFQFFIVSLQILPTLDVFFLDSTQLFETTFKVLKDIDNQEPNNVFLICFFLNKILSQKKKEFENVEILGMLNETLALLTGECLDKNEEKVEKVLCGTLVSIYFQVKDDDFLSKLCHHDKARAICDAYLKLFNRPEDDGIHPHAALFFLKNILEKDAGQFFSTNDYLFLIDVIYREIELLSDNCVSEKLLMEYCKTLIVMINSSLWEEYEG